MSIDVKQLIAAGKAQIAKRQAAQLQVSPPPMPPEDAAAIIATLADELAAQRAEELAAMPPEAPKPTRLKRLSEYPPVIPEKENTNIIIKGRWLERGGSAFLVSTAGTGKSIWSIQFALSMVYAQSFSGLEAWRPFKCWIVQSEDSDDRVSIDRDDIIAGLELQDDIISQQTGKKRTHDWKEAADNVTFAEFTGLTGAEFLEELENELAQILPADMPDVLIINPLLDFLGGDMCSQEATSAFLSGGRIAGKHTKGLRSILRRFGVAALIVHHTGKPPSESELKSWIKSAMPEYQAAGSSYITNWGRSFITMMKIPNVQGAVMLTAGKNGGGLKWDIIGGARRRFLVWSDAPSVAGDGSRRHFWAEPSEAERMAILSQIGFEDTEANKAQADALTLAEYLHEHPMTASDIQRGLNCEDVGLPQRRMRSAYRLIEADPNKYGLVAEKDFDKGPLWYRQMPVDNPQPIEIQTEFL